MLQKFMGRGRARFCYFRWTLACCLGVLMANPLRAASPEKTSHQPKKPRLEDKLKRLSKGSSSREAQRKGLAELPLDQLTPAQRAKAQNILRNLSLFRELPTLAVETDPAVYRFFLDHPEMAVSIWRAMKISKFHLTEQQPGRYTATDNAGTAGSVEVLYRDPRQVLVFCNGVVQSPLVPGAIQARTLLHLQMDFVKTEDGLIWSRNRVRMYVSFPSQAVEAAAKVVSPLGNLIIDRNLREVSLFIAMMSTAMVHQPGWVEHIARNLEGVSQERRSELIELTAKVFVAARKRELAKQKADREITLEDIIRPLSTAGPANQTSDETQ